MAHVLMPAGNYRQLFLFVQLLCVNLVVFLPQSVESGTLVSVEKVPKSMHGDMDFRFGRAVERSDTFLRQPGNLFLDEHSEYVFGVLLAFASPETVSDARSDDSRTESSDI